MRFIAPFSVCIHPIDATDDPTTMAPTLDAIMEQWWRVRTLRVEFDLTATTDFGSTHVSYTGVEFPMHQIYGVTPAPQNESDLARLDVSGDALLAVTTKPAAAEIDEIHGDVEIVVGVEVELFRAGTEGRYLYFDAATGRFHSHQRVRLTVSTVTEVESELFHLAYRAFHLGAGQPHSSTPSLHLVDASGVIYGSEEVETNMERLDVVGNVTLVPVSFWPWAKEDGTEPVWDAVTGAQLRNPLEG